MHQTKLLIFILSPLSFIDKNPKDEYEKTPLHYTAEENHLETFKLIFENIDEKNPADKDGITPLHLAAQKGHKQICEMILDVVQDIHPRTKNGKIPFDFAAQRLPDREIIDLLGKAIFRIIFHH